MDPDHDGGDDTESRRAFVECAASLAGVLALGAVPSATAREAAAAESEANGDDDGDDDVRPEASDLNEADIEFLQEMIPHHWGAVTMANLVPTHTDREPLVELAEEMASAQSDQIARMEAILAEADVSYRTDNVPEASDIPGMPSEDGMATLRTVVGEEFDLTFVNLMTAHHRGAVILARRVLEEGQSAAIADMAERMIASQRAEIYALYEYYLEWADPPETESMAAG